jgi:hypothetical protein
MDARSRLALLVSIAVLAGTVSACGEGPPASPALPPLPEFIPAGATRGPAPRGDEVIDCDRLLSAADLQAVVGAPVRALGWNLNSCFWRTPARVIQLVLQTGPEAHRWFTGLSQPGESAGMNPVGGLDFEALAKPGAFGGYAPGRAALLHSPLSTEAAAPLVRQVLSRL